VLLYGPPGCGKTLLAKAVANECRANFISVKGPELLNKYVGESERAVREVFRRARSSAPCIIFFDEVDALCPKRTGQDNKVADRIVNQFLVELDGLDQRYQIFIVCATNRPDMIDPAMLRPGRLDKMLFVPLPDPTERVLILKTQVKRTPLHSSVEIPAIAMDKRTNGFSGADLAQLVREAATAALQENLDSGDPSTPVVTKEHFEIALNKVLPSVSKKDELSYNLDHNKIRSSRIRMPQQINNNDTKTNRVDTPNKEQ